MTTSSIANNSGRPSWQIRDVVGWIGLAATPTFATMAWTSAPDAPQMAICSTASGVLPIDGMTWMYVLMSIFHVSPWLKLASGRPRRFTHPTTHVEGD